jgi:hypothetical protein
MAGFSNGRFSSTGRFSAPNARQTEEQRVAYEDEVSSFDPLEEVRDEYKRLTTTFVNRLQDWEAFNRCADQFGFGRAVKALKKISEKAAEKAREYAQRMAAKRGGQ